MTRRSPPSHPRLRTPPRHPLRPARHLIYRLLAAALLLAGAAASGAPEKKPPLAKQFLAFGTVFDERGFALPGAEIRVRRARERKVRWRAWSDARGEFGLRFPTGEEYELKVVAKGYGEESRRIDARTGVREDLVFRMQPSPKGKKP